MSVIAKFAKYIQIIPTQGTLTAIVCIDKDCCCFIYLPQCLALCVNAATIAAANRYYPHVMVLNHPIKMYLTWKCLNTMISEFFMIQRSQIATLATAISQLFGKTTKCAHRNSQYWLVGSCKNSENHETYKGIH